MSAVAEDEPRLLASAPAATESAPASAAGEPVAAPVAAPLLDGGEIVQLTLKPSLWYIPIVSFRFIVGTALVALAWAAAASSHLVPVSALVVQLLLYIPAARLAIAALQWASRVYILTDRRVMRLRGILKAEVAECPLAAIHEATLHVAGYQRILRLGTIRVTPAAANAIPLAWEQLARPAEVHELLIRAIRRSQG